MNWKTSGIFCISFLICFFAEIAVNIACGGGEEDPYDYFTSFFQNDLNGQDYEQFRFSELVYLYHEGNSDTEQEINAKEWANYLKIKPEDAAALYQIDSATSASITRGLELGKVVLNDTLTNKAFFSALQKNKKALVYYAFAKRCEPYVDMAFDPWDPAVRDTAAMVQHADEALKLMKKSRKDPFLRLRYAYQAERLYHYAAKYQLSQSVYENFIANEKSNSAVKGWSTSIYAGATRRTGNSAKAAYLFSKVFASNPERRTQTYKDFFFTDAKLASILPFAKNDEERAFIYGIKGFGTSDLDSVSLTRVYELAPQSEIVEVLLLREINKLERRFLNSSRFSYYDTYDSMNAEAKTETMNQLSRVEQFSVKLATSGFFARPNLGYLSASYLNWMKGDLVKAKTYLKQLNPATLESKYLNQYRVIELLIQTNEIKKSATFNASDLLPALNWLDEQCRAELVKGAMAVSDQRFTKITRDLYQRVLAPIYFKNRDTVLTALLLLKGDVTAQKTVSIFQNMGYETTDFWQNQLTPKSMERLLYLQKNPSKDGYNGLLSSLLVSTDQDSFYELFGTTYLRTHQYQKALKCFQQISDQYAYAPPSDWYNDQVLYASPFQTTINDYPKNYGSSSALAINKKGFAERMVNLERKIKTDPKNAASYYFQMANGVYQTGYYGNSWGFISYSWSSYAYSEPANRYYDSDFKLALTAKKWYLKARGLSTNPDFRAQCTFMLAKCEQKFQTNRIFTENESFNRYDVAQGNFYRNINLGNRYFKELKMNYSHTPYFKKAAFECTYLADFLNQTR